MSYDLVIPVMLRFILGGTAIVACALIARFSGPRLGGSLLHFPLSIWQLSSVWLSIIVENSWSICRYTYLRRFGRYAGQYHLCVGSQPVDSKKWLAKGLGLALLIWLLAASGIYMSWQVVMA